MCVAVFVFWFVSVSSIELDWIGQSLCSVVTTYFGTQKSQIMLRFVVDFSFVVSHLLLAPSYCLQELLPFVTDGTDDEDEVLLALANSLGKLIPLVGGGSHAQSLLPPLELLLTVEENSVRDAATASTLLVAAALPEEAFLDKYVSMLGRLANKEWFTARISSAGLIADAYPRLTPMQQQEHLVLFAELCQDDTPMVRRVAAQSLGKMVGNVVGAAGRASLEKGGVVTTILIPLYETLSSNEQPVSELEFLCSIVCCSFVCFPNVCRCM